VFHSFTASGPRVRSPALGVRGPGWYPASTPWNARPCFRVIVSPPCRLEKKARKLAIASLSRRCRPFTVSTTLAVAVRIPRVPRVPPLARSVRLDRDLRLSTLSSAGDPRIAPTSRISLVDTSRFPPPNSAGQPCRSPFGFLTNGRGSVRILSDLNLCQIANLSFRVFRTIAFPLLDAR